MIIRSLKQTSKISVDFIVPISQLSFTYIYFNLPNRRNGISEEGTKNNNFNDASFLSFAYYILLW